MILGSFTYSNCGAGCAATQVSGPSIIEVLKEGHETAKVTGEGEVHVNCPGIDCYFNGEELIGTGKGPLLSKEEHGSISIQEQTVKKTKGSACPSTVRLDIFTTPLVATYITAGAEDVPSIGTALCGSDEEKCASPNTHVHETTTTKARLLASPEVQCDALFLGEVGALGMPQTIEGNFTYSNCGGGCSVTEEGGPSLIEVFKEGHETTGVRGEGEVHVNCFGINCYYNGMGLWGAGKGPLLSTAANGEVNISGQTVNKVKGIFCPSEGKLDINTTPLSATYITG